MGTSRKTDYFSNDFGKSKKWRRFANSWVSTCCLSDARTNAGAYKAHVWWSRPLGHFGSIQWGEEHPAIQRYLPGQTTRIHQARMYFIVFLYPVNIRKYQHLPAMFFQTRALIGSNDSNDPYKAGPKSHMNPILILNTTLNGPNGMRKFHEIPNKKNMVSFGVFKKRGMRLT